MDSITNYYESLVFDSIRYKLAGTPQAYDEDYIADIACVALNRLPARYVRHMIDTRFFESEDDRRRIDQSVDRAVSAALAFINEREGNAPDGTAHTRLD